jgi:hypothetical protein
MPAHPRRHLAHIVRAIKVAEDAIHVVVAVLLTALGVALIVYTMRQIAVVLTGHYDMPATMLAILNETLLLFIVAELLHTVAIAIKHGSALDPGLFIVVGLVAGIRKCSPHASPVTPSTPPSSDPPGVVQSSDECGAKFGELVGRQFPLTGCGISSYLFGFCRTGDDRSNRWHGRQASDGHIQE